MLTSQAFDAVVSPLEGVSLIEASAGTGKTYTIATIVTRLIVEQHLLISHILVVTFTNAATEELRDRIRSRLRDAYQACEAGHSDDPTMSCLLQKWDDLEDAKLRLKHALHGFDEAPIFTIHGFCQRVLRDNAFESGALFDTELVTDDHELLQEIIDDFWRRHFYHASHLFVQYVVMQQKLTPEKLLAMLGRYTGQPLLKVLPTDVDMIKVEESHFQKAYQQVYQAWQTQRAEVMALLLNCPDLNGNKYRQASIHKWLTEMDLFLASEQPTLALSDSFFKFTLDAVIDGTKKGKQPPESTFFEVCQVLWHAATALTDNYSQQLLGLKKKLLGYCKQELKRRKQRQNIQSFDDLLLNLYNALQGQGGWSLLQAIQQRYPAALIDEFQDTDPLQYDIFQRIYQQQDDTEGLLFLIGDPKQAIYSFRGADIFAYMKASDDATNRYTLATNWRSEPRLITAINHLFQFSDAPFMFEQIPFNPVASAEKDHLHFQQHSEQVAPLQFWFFDEALAGTSPIPKNWATDTIPQYVSEEIVQLLASQNLQAKIGTQTIKAGDIAVLVRTNRQASLIQAALRQRQISSVVYGRESLFASREALQLEQLLAALVEPGNEYFIRAALVTDLLGIDGNQLDQLQQDEMAWESWLMLFREYHDVWQTHGFIYMFRHFMRQHKVSEQLLGFVDGERRLTNVLHLLEILHHASVSPRRGMAQLLRWLSAARQGVGVNQDEAQLRLESDEDAVKLVTIHKSKGLEYSIVFAPFAWDGQLRVTREKQFVFHNKKDDREINLDIGSAQQEENRAYALEEEKAENCRLLYVALTRAKYRCYIAWGDFKSVEQSALTHLLLDDDVEVNVEMMRKSLAELVRASQDTIQWNQPPDLTCTRYQLGYQPDPLLKANDFTRKIARNWHVTSFTGLTARGHAEKPDYDQATQVSVDTVPVALPEQQADIFAFPAGARPGVMMHELFEYLDFTNHEQTLEDLVSGRLAKYGYERQWQSTLYQLVENVLMTPLDRDNAEMQLINIAKQQRLDELEFFYPLQQLNIDGLANIFSRFGADSIQHLAKRIKTLNFMSTQGFMKGYIDMVFEFEGRFYVLDYKSNKLGDRLEDYDLQGMVAAMQQHDYYLQYHIYCVALHRYLQLRLPDYDYTQHFGGVYYLFLRGMHPQYGADYGVFFDRPLPALIENLSDYLAG